MSKLYLIQNGKCIEKDGNTSRTVGNSGAVQVSQGLFDNKESYAILYQKGDVYLTTGNGTVKISSGINSPIISTQFYNNGIIFSHENGKKYFRNKSSGNEIR